MTTGVASNQAVVPPDVLTRIVADVFKVWPTYHCLGEAAGAHDLRTRLPMMRVLKVHGDRLAVYAEKHPLLPELRIATMFVTAV